MITANSLTVAVKVIPVTYALAKTTVYLAFRPKSIAAVPRITCATVIAGQAITLRTVLTSLMPINLIPVVVKRGPDPEREFNQPIPVPLTIRLTLTTSRLMNLSQRDPPSDGDIRPRRPNTLYEIDSTNLNCLTEPPLL